METVAITLPFHYVPLDRRKAVMNNYAPSSPPSPSAGYGTEDGEGEAGGSESMDVWVKKE